MIKTKHIFQLSRIIDKMGLWMKTSRTSLLKPKKKNVDESALGYKIITALGEETPHG